MVVRHPHKVKRNGSNPFLGTLVHRSNLCYDYKVTKLYHQGDLAQLVERLFCKQEVRGSTPLVSTPL